MKKDKAIILILAIITVIVYFTVSSFLENLKTGSPQPSPIPSPTHIPFPTGKIPSFPTSMVDVAPPTQQQVYLRNLLNEVPYSTSEFDIEYYKSSSAFMVTIKESPLDENKKKAQQWFLDRGVKDLSELKILYNHYRWVQ